MHRTLHKAFTDAMRWGRLDRNPAALAESPPLARVEGDARAAQHAWAPGELRRFLEHVRGTRYGVLFHLAAATGARRSELLAVRWSDVALDAARLSFRRTYVRDETSQYMMVDRMKSSHAFRTISLDTSTVRLLRSHRAAQLQDRLRAGSAWADNDLVLTQRDGTPLSPHAVSMAFPRAAKAAGVPCIRFHDLRQTHATLLLQNGVPIRTVSQRLGHATPTVTMQIYSHILPGDDQAAAARFADLIEVEATC